MNDNRQALLERLADLRLQRIIVQTDISTLRGRQLKRDRQLERDRQRLNVIGDRERMRARRATMDDTELEEHRARMRTAMRARRAMDATEQQQRGRDTQRDRESTIRDMIQL